MVLGIQIAGILFGLFMIYYTFLIFKRREFTRTEFSLLSVFWALFIFIAAFPYLLAPIVKSFGFLRALDLLVISGFIFLIASIFYTYTITRKNQKQLETVVREIAIKNSKRK